MELRDYQKASLNALYSYFEKKDGNPVVALPTGTGKSLVIAAMAELALRFDNQRVIVLTHVKELIDQNYKTAVSMYELDAGIYSAGLKRRDTTNNLIFAGIASINRRAEELGPFNLIMIDECHLVSDKGTTMYRKYIDKMKEWNPLVKVIGFSATPYRLRTGLLTDSGVFTDICYDLTSLKAYNKLVDDGWIAPLIAKAPHEELDISNVHMRGGEFIPGELERAVNHTCVTERAVAEAINLAVDRKHWLVFASGIEHCESVAHILRQYGIVAVAIHSKISSEVRDRRIREFKRGEIRALVNNNILTTGFDFPPIDLIVMLRPTMSPGLWVQMLGRGSRIFGGKENCLVLDFAGNTKRLGPINNVILPLSGRGTKGVKRKAPVKVCEICRTINPLAARTCFACGAEFPKTYNIKSRASTLDVVAKEAPGPVIEVLPVFKVSYAKHTKKGTKKGGKTSMKVTYQVGLFNTYREWVCFEHDGYARHKAIEWWRRRTLWPVPSTVDEALTKIESLKEPEKIKVNLSGKYPEIIGFYFPR